VGVRDVVVNGVVALRDGVPTGARPGRALRRRRTSA
jgi:N-acyl-D-amino-acid deacylase